MSRERPILFSAPMVRAIVAGTKTQTRRVVKFPHSNPLGRWEPTVWETKGCVDGRGQPVPEISVPAIWHTRTGDTQLCPYGHPGDGLWVKETYMVFERTASVEHSRGHEPRIVGYLPGGFGYRADSDDCGQVPVTENGETVLRTPKGKWKPSTCMPRRASRINLEITGVRVERLNAISEADAVAEGCVIECMRPDGSDNGTAIWNPGGYVALWESINGAGSWHANPWVWVVEFKRVTA